ncbi:hypothetical protein Sta7437_4441 [Stanieria cyanosphaera PCC 7437]|uniref:vWA-MoxR associated protein N-terminal HTH domain-containing protein n=1 Tax=Stanieria cyanosphaera (strain ATCC 29371 / PCC 7437) TaxID=111780 RepID=K9Y0S4_STAC7|nr:hypothetical protein [Stanieria cyanosphaera]AFZ37909.1 hypothetical protein Sta7437_4441 [Stanieria cyanosphaera PCC 7437]
MNFEEALVILQSSFEPKGLNDLQEMVFLYAWQGKTYEEIAVILDYDTDYIRQIGSLLWRSLSQALKEKVTKKNFRSVLKRYQEIRDKQKELDLFLKLERGSKPEIAIDLGNPYTISIYFPISTTQTKARQQLVNNNSVAVAKRKDDLPILPADELFSFLEKLDEIYANSLHNTSDLKLKNITLMLSLSFV